MLIFSATEIGKINSSPLTLNSLSLSSQELKFKLKTKKKRSKQIVFFYCNSGTLIVLLIQQPMAILSPALPEEKISLF